MRTHIWFGGLFWAFLFILIGILLLLKIVFNLNIPVFRVILAIVIIYFGLRLLIGKNSYNSEQTIVFSDTEIKAENADNDYSIIFGKGLIDLTSMKQFDKRIKIAVVFGSAVVKLDPNKSYEIRSSCAFSSVVFPDENRISFGDYKYKYGEDLSNVQIIYVDVVFGECVVEFSK